MTSFSVLLWIIVGVFVIDTLVLFIYSFTMGILIILSKKNRKSVLVQKEELAQYPFVTVQIPIYNEKYVVKRIINKALAINYPKNRMEIQVLDDSTDETLDISQAIVTDYVKHGYNIIHIHRQKRTGYKGGALREGLKSAKGEFIVIFDADFIPERDIVIKLLPLFLENRNLGMIQTRWGHLNPGFSPLTKAQSIIIDSHFVVEQAARSAHNFFFNFNGTAGIWRKSCILDAGNWQDDTLTEDCDLSFRAALRNWEFKYIDNIVNEAELPVHLQAYKSQQFRWAKGSIQTIKKLGKKILSSSAGLLKKTEAMIHLSYYSVHPLLLLNILLINPLIMSREISSIFQTFFGTGALVLSFSVFIPFILFIHTIMVIRKNWKQRLSWIPYTILFGTGLAVNNSIAVLQAIAGTPSAFVRTPKTGIQMKAGKLKKNKYVLKSRFPLYTLLELFFCLYSGTGIIFAWMSGKYVIIPFLLIYFLAFGNIYVLGLVQHITTKKQHE